MSAKGERNAHAKLRATQVLALRVRHDAGDGERLVALAREFGITTTTASLIVTGRIWVDVGGPIRPARPHRLSRLGMRFCPIDGYEIEHTTDARGFLVLCCEACKRRWQGRCMDCGTSVRGRAWRCAVHAAARRDQYVAECRSRHREEYSRKQRDRYRALRGEARRQHLEYKKQWRRANPRKVYEQKRRARVRGCGGYATREKYLAYHRAYNAQYKRSA